VTRELASKPRPVPSPAYHYTELNQSPEKKPYKEGKMKHISFRRSNAPPWARHDLWTGVVKPSGITVKKALKIRNMKK
jgi:hypothetical protein